MGASDFTTFTEFEEDDRIQKTAYHADFLAYMNEDAYLYKDMGAAHFTDFIHRIDIKRVSHFGTHCGAFLWMLSNDIQDGNALQTASKTFISIYVQYWYEWAATRIRLFESYGGVGYLDSSVDITEGVMYYLKIVKSGTSLVCGIYSTAELRDAGDGTDGDIDNLALTLQADHTFRYVWVCNTWDSAETPYSHNDIENLNLGEPIAYEVTITEKLGMLDSIPTKAAFKQSVTDILGMTDTVTKQKSMFQTISDILGLTDTVGTKVAFKQAVTDIIGMLDTVTRHFPLAVTITDILGMRDRLITKKRRFPLPDLPDHTTRGGAPE